MKKILLVTIVTAVVFGGAGFYGGLKYGQSRTVFNRPAGNFGNLTAGQRQQIFQSGGGAGSGITGLRGGQNGGGFVTGEIIAKDDEGITVKIRDGGSKIVLFSNSTKIEKTVDGTGNDLTVGQSVTVSGQTNQDGSLTAQSIQTRLATPALRPQP